VSFFSPLLRAGNPSTIQLEMAFLRWLAIVRVKWGGMYPELYPETDMDLPLSPGWFSIA
jgi:hypothetical protein